MTGNALDSPPSSESEPHATERLTAISAILRGLCTAALLYAAIRTYGYYVGYPTTYRHHVEAAWFIAVALVLTACLVDGRREEARDQPPARQSSPWLAPVVFLVFLLLALIVYWPALSVGLLSDDFVLIGWAREGRIWPSDRWEHFRPLPLSIWAALVRAGADVMLFHLVNLAVHAANAFLVTAIARRLGVSLVASVAAGLLFLAYPLNVEAVVWTAGLQDLLMTTGCLLLAWSAIGSEDSRRGSSGENPRLAEARSATADLSRLRWFAAAGGAAVAVLSKETGVVAPALALVLIPLVPHRFRKAGAALVAAGAIVAVSYVAWRMSVSVLPEHYAVTAPARYAIKELVSRPFGALAAPFSEEILQRYSAAGVSIGWVVLALLAAVVWNAQLPRRHLAAAGIAFTAWILLSVAPAHPYLYVAPNLQGSRYIYLATCGWVLLLAALLRGAVPRTRWAWGALVPVLFAMALTGSMMAARWHQRDWTEAARIRDLVLIETHRVLGARHCRGEALIIDALPDSAGGAYIFRNGFREAIAPLEMRGGPTAAPERCRFRWTGQTLEDPTVSPR